MEQLSLVPSCEKHGCLKVWKGAGRNGRWRCVECRRQQSREWAKRDYHLRREEISERRKVRRATVPGVAEKEKAAALRWAALNRDRHLAYRREYNRKWYAANPGRQLEASRRWRSSSEVARIGNAARRARRRDRTRLPLCPVDKAIVRAIYAKRVAMGEGFHVDHILPLWLGGDHAPWNLQIVPAAANYSKQGRLPTLREVMQGERRYRLLRRIFERELGTAAA